MKKSLESNSLETVSGNTTIADGISVKTPGKLTFDIVKEKIDKIVTVDDKDIINAMFLLMERSKAVVEPAGAVALAYILKHKPESGKTVVPILCGGNIDMYLLGQIVSKGLSGMGRMLKISVLLKDKPGALKELVDEISSDTNSTVIHAFDDSHVIAGQGVIGLEIIEELPDVDEIYVPIGGGGLVAGIITAVKEKHPNVKIIGVESSAYPAMKKSLESNSLETVSGNTTIADGILSLIHI